MAEGFRTETIETGHGSVEVQVTDCDSCGATVHKEDATRFTLGDREGWACAYCADEGPIEFPGRRSDVSWTMAGIYAVLWPLSLWVSAVGAVTEKHGQDGEVPRYGLAMSAGALLWLTAHLLVTGVL